MVTRGSRWPLMIDPQGQVSTGACLDVNYVALSVVVPNVIQHKTPPALTSEGWLQTAAGYTVLYLLGPHLAARTVLFDAVGCVSSAVGSLFQTQS